jgi:transcriptional regulator with XRE-family HTH domain
VSEEKVRRLGEWLRQRREELGIDLQQAAAETRIRARFLEALESEEFSSLPGPVVGRGFLRNYAVYLNLDPQEATRLFSEQVAPPEPESLIVEGPSPFTRGPFQPVPLHEVPGRYGGWLWLVGLLLVVLAVAASLAWWYYPYLSDWIGGRKVGDNPMPTQQATDVTLVTATNTPKAVASAAVPTSAPPVQATVTLDPAITVTRTPFPTLTPSPPVYTGIFLELVFTDTSWIQVTVDGVRQFQGELAADTHRSWYGEERIELRIGNAGAVLVTMNGQSLGALGATGEVVERVFEKAANQVNQTTPTPEITGTVTTEPVPTSTVETLRPTSTVSVTSTPLVTPTATLVPTVPVTFTATASP